MRVCASVCVRGSARVCESVRGSEGVRGSDGSEAVRGSEGAICEGPRVRGYEDDVKVQVSDRVCG